MHCRSRLLFLLVIIVVFTSRGGVIAQDGSGSREEPHGKPVEFEQLTFVAGLVNSSVSSIVQDDAGFLWFGTQAGLQRYDGYGMKLYTAEPFNSNSLSNQLVQTAYLAPDNVMWVGTYGGLNRKDILSEEFSAFTHVPEDPTTLSNNVVTSITHDAGGTLWVATLDGLNRLDDVDEKRFTRFMADPEDPSALRHDTVRSLFRDSRDRMWVGSLGGLSLLTEDENGRTRFSTWDAGPDGLVSPYVMTITEDDAGYLWLGTWDGGLSRFDPEEETFDHFPLPDNRVYTVMVTAGGLVYAGTWGGGLYILDPGTGEITEYRHDPEVPGSLAHDVVYSLHEDRSGLIWIGTNGNGLNKFDPTRDFFRYIHPDLPREQRLDSGKIHVLWRDPDTGDLYVGLQNNGLNVVDGETGEVTRYAHDENDSDSISSDTVNGLLPEPEGTFLISTHAGINRFHPPAQRGERGRFELVSDPDIPDPIVYRMIRDRANRIWIGTYSSGVFRYDPDGDLHRYSNDPGDSRSLSDNLVYDLLEDGYGTIWIATNGGLNRYQPGTDDFDRFTYDPENTDGLSGANTADIVEDHAGVLWVGSRSGGLNRFDRETETFRHYTIQEGLSSNTVTAIAEGDPGFLYVATPNGLNLLHTASGRVDRIDERDGLTTREFSTGVTRDTDGALLFGAFSEVVRVAPRFAERDGAPAPTVITEARVVNEPLPLPLEYIHDADLELTHEENFLEFSFAVLDFSVPARNEYRYRLVGFDSDWIDAGTRNTATYTNVPPGSYEFQVAGTDSRGVPSPDYASVRILIRPPFWQTPWFMAGIVVLVVGLIAAVYVLRVRTLRRVNRLLEETVAERTARLTEANEVKDRFFSIIAHDLRGPISGIESVTRNAVTEFTDYSEELLKEIFSTLHSSAQGLLGMLENLLEWARVQSGRIAYAPQQVSLSEVLTGVVEANRGAAQAKSVELRFQCSGDVYATADLDMLRVITQNLVNNAIKFTPRDGTVTVQCRVSVGVTDHVEVVVSDTGVGIPEEKISELFLVDRRYRTTGTAGERGSGFGLSLCNDLVHRQNGTIDVSSDTASGTTVVVTLPAAAGGPA